MGQLNGMFVSVLFAGRGNSTLCGEFNFASDPDAAYVVLSELNKHITLLPWEVNLSSATGQPWVRL